ncbi:GNAT family N-acetyltransferase [Litchfieldia alkalitelluris]|uniref:GNAT family N-acetyltransferase n=1 Tax=Litchfieldia alkalitelluris TaxID=304268 RepID=UPI00099893DD|nr:GNAT family N-acetyltransferase [Litchfieldia alkalitelluris]
MDPIISKIEMEKAWELRREVMWHEKPFDYIKLKEDHIGIHFGVIKEGDLISVISLFVNNDEAQFRKFATLQQEQGKGYGGALLGYVINDCLIMMTNSKRNLLSYIE